MKPFWNRRPSEPVASRPASHCDAPSEADRRLALLQGGDAWNTRLTCRQLAERIRLVAVVCNRLLTGGAPALALRPQDWRPWVFARSRWDVVDDVARERLGWASSNNISVRASIAGRLLAYFPDETLNCGAAEAVTNGLFDVHNAPPWATWVAYFEDPGSTKAYLIAWIPAALERACAEAIDFNPEGCIEWLSDGNVALRSLVAGGHGGLEATWLTGAR